MARRETASERAAWTEFVEGKNIDESKRTKYGSRRCEFNGKMYASQHEANTAAKLQPLARAGKIKQYEEQKRIVLVPGDGKLRSIIYIADFFFIDLDGTPHLLDAKGFKTPVYRLKKRLAALLLRITIEEC